MKICVLPKTDQIELQDWPIPQVWPEAVLVRVNVCGICGSDVAAWRGSGHKKYPYTPGHEFCGTIEQMGEKVCGLKLGQRVVIDPNLGCGECRFCRIGKPNLCDYLKSRPIKSNGGLAEFVALDYRMVHPLPDALPDKLAPFVEPLSCALHATNTAKLAGGEFVVIFGAGLMGILTGIVLSSAQIELIFVELSEKRQDRLFKLLDYRAISPVELDKSDFVGQIDVAIDCSGNAKAVAQAIKVLRNAGRLILSGIVMNPDGAGISLVDVTTKELQLTGVWLNPNTFAQAIDLAVASRDILENLNVEEFTLEQVQTAFERATNPDSLKVVVKPW